MSATVAVVDYGAGNLGNARRALATLGFRDVLVRTPAELPPEGPIVLPGVGAHGAAMETLAGGGLADALRAAAAAGRTVIGICLGLQLLFERSEESNEAAGLGILRGTVRRLDPGDRPLPHLGWCPVGQRRTPYYFAHSYRVVPADATIVSAWATWGEAFPAMVRAGAVAGVQFHPERSGAAGLELLRRLLAGGAAAP